MNRVLIGMTAVAFVLSATACDSTHHTASRNKQTQEPVVYATDITSPDGTRIAVVRHTRNASYLEVGSAGGGPRRTIFDSPLYITTDVYWALPNLIAFGDSDFTVCSDGRWIAWSQFGGEAAPDRVGIVSIDGGNCRVPRPPNAVGTGAFFKPGVKRVFFLREPYDPSRGVFGSGRIISVPLSSLRPC